MTDNYDFDTSAVENCESNDENFLIKSVGKKRKNPRNCGYSNAKKPAHNKVGGSMRTGDEKKVSKSAFHKKSRQMHQKLVA